MAGLFGKTPAPPPISAPAPMPDNSSPAVLEAQRKAAADAMARSGRTSTILTDTSGPAANQRGTDSYAGKQLAGN